MGKKGPRAKIKTVLKSVDMDMVTTWPEACKLTILKLIKTRHSKQCKTLGINDVHMMR